MSLIRTTLLVPVLVSLAVSLSITACSNENPQVDAEVQAQKHSREQAEAEVQAQKLAREQAEAAARKKQREWEIARTRLKQIGLAMQMYAIDNLGRLPIPAMATNNDGTTVSWRVMLTPYLGHRPQYKKTEPWDSEANQAALQSIPESFQPSGGPPVPQGHTRIRAILGPDTAYAGHRFGRTKDSVVTIMLVETDESVPWTKPEDWELDPANPLRGLGTIREGKVLALDAKGNVVVVLTAAGPQRVLETMIANDGKPTDTAGLIEPDKAQSN
ncbi:MAG: DUF1559 domain-containing protein [Phycisphaeraceae bacterium]